MFFVCVILYFRISFVASLFPHLPRHFHSLPRLSSSQLSRNLAAVNYTTVQLTILPLLNRVRRITHDEYALCSVDTDRHRISCMDVWNISTCSYALCQSADRSTLITYNWPRQGRRAHQFFRHNERPTTATIVSPTSIKFRIDFTCHSVITHKVAQYLFMVTISLSNIDVHKMCREWGTKTLTDETPLLLALY